MFVDRIYAQIHFICNLLVGDFRAGQPEKLFFFRFKFIQNIPGSIFLIFHFHKTLRKIIGVKTAFTVKIMLTVTMVWVNCAVYISILASIDLINMIQQELKIVLVFYSIKKRWMRNSCVLNH